MQTVVICIGQLIVSNYKNKKAVHKSNFTCSFEMLLIFRTASECTTCQNETLSPIKDHAVNQCECKKWVMHGRLK